MGLLESRLDTLRGHVPEVSPAEAMRLQRRDAAWLVDVREPDEWALGLPVGAVAIARGQLELKLPALIPDPHAVVLLICGSGLRSMLAADALQRLGYRAVMSVAGGYRDWKAAGLPTEKRAQLTERQRERHARHLSIPQVGVEGQLRLQASRVLLIGAGGLGSPCALYLAAAGVGTIGLVDHDVVERSNLQRQVLHADDRIGMPKVESVRAALLALDPDLRINLHPVKLDAHNVDALLADYDLVVDGTDNFETRYLVNDAAVRRGIPDIHAAVYQFEGYVSVFSPGQHRGPCYRCMHPTAPPPDLAPSCAEAGVLGVLPGVIGLLQAVEALKLLLRIGEPLVGRLLSYDALAATFDEFTIDRDPGCAACGLGSGTAAMAAGEAQAPGRAHALAGLPADADAAS